MSVQDFAPVYPIIHVNVSKHKERLKMGTTDHEIRWQLASKFQKVGGGDGPYHVYCVLLRNRYITFEAVSGKMNVII